MTDAEREAYTRFTERTTPPTAPAREAWVVRRPSRRQVADGSRPRRLCGSVPRYRPFLKPGERAVVMVIAGDREQAGVVFKYIEGVL